MIDHKIKNAGMQMIAYPTIYKPGNMVIAAVMVNGKCHIFPGECDHDRRNYRWIIRSVFNLFQALQAPKDIHYTAADPIVTIRTILSSINACQILLAHVDRNALLTIIPPVRFVRQQFST